MIEIGERAAGYAGQPWTQDPWAWWQVSEGLFFLMSALRPEGEFVEPEIELSPELEQRIGAGCLGGIQAGHHQAAGHDHRQFSSRRGVASTKAAARSSATSGRSPSGLKDLCRNACSGKARHREQGLDAAAFARLLGN